MKINRDEYLSHINDSDEENSMRRLLDLIEITLNRHIPTNTDFLEPNLIELSKSILNRFENVNYRIDGGFKNAERNVLSIYNDYYRYEESDVPIVAVSISGNIKNIEHRDVLGSVLGLGLKRNKIGDIGFFEDSIKLVLMKDIADFVYFNLKKIGNESVKLNFVSLESLSDIIENGTNRNIISPSLRLDAVISEAFKISRSESQKLIKSELVKVNFSKEIRCHKELKESDLISVRGKGRVRIVSIDGLTKKERVKLTVFYPE